MGIHIFRILSTAKILEEEVDLTLYVVQVDS